MEANVQAEMSDGKEETEDTNEPDKSVPDNVNKGIQLYFRTTTILTRL